MAEGKSAVRKRIIKIASVLLCLLLVWIPAETACADGVTSESIRKKEEQIKQARQEKTQLQNSLTDIKKLKESLEKEKKNLKSYVTTLDASLAQMEENIEQLSAQITRKEAEIIQTQEEMEQAQETADAQYESMRTRIRIMYEVQSTASIWDFLMSADDFGDFLNKADYINTLYAYDQKMWDGYVENCEYIALCKEQLQLEKELLDEQKTSVEEEQKKVEDLITEKQKQITAYETDINTQQKAIAEYEQEIADQDALIAQLEKAVKEEKMRLIYDGGTFRFPLASYTRISDDYGYRMHPTLGVRKFHNGVDLAAPKGTSIYAAYDGAVIAAGYSATMGNYVMLHHGDDLYTIYMHASKLLVKTGDSVKAGDTIAQVGSTGRSTGNHLHFGVRRDGVYVSPWEYLSR